MSPPPSLADLLAVAPDDAAAALADVVPDARAVDHVVVEPVDYASGSPATGGLYRVRGACDDGSAWAVFVKVLQHVRHWPALVSLPPPIAEQFTALFPWRAELELWHPLVQASLPDGLRSPVLHRLAELGDDRAAIWMEDVREAAGGRDLASVARAAHLLGRWNARSRSEDLLALNGFPAGYALRMYVDNSVPLRGLGPLADDDVWSHPWLADHGPLRDRLRTLADGIPGLLDRLDGLEQCLPHGDASPQNLLVPAEAPTTLVAIDLGFRTPHALGFDLGQLLVGLTQAGQVPASLLPAIAGRIVPAYLDGLAAEGWRGDADDVCWAFTASTLLRSGFDGLRHELLDQGDDARHAFDERIRMVTFLVDQHTGRV